MINVSNEFKRLMNERTDFKQNAEVTFTDGTTLSLSEADFSVSNNSVADAADANSIPLGVAISRSIQIELMNDDDHLLEYDFFGAKIRLYLTYQLSETVEKIEYGDFTVTTPETYGTTVIISANDDMYKADKAYSTSLAFPTTIRRMLIDCCDTCGIPFLSAAFPNDDFVVAQKPSKDYTHRQIIGYIAMIAGGNARVNRQGYLEILPYSFDFSQEHHSLANWKSLKVDTDDITITGVQATYEKEVSVKDDDGNETTESQAVTILEGEEGYVLSISNPLILGQEQTAVSLIGEALIGITFRKFEGDHIAYPLAEFMDLTELTDRKGNVYRSFLTDINFVFFGFTTMKNSAESGVRNSSKYFSNPTAALIEARKLVQKEKTARETAVENLAKTLANSSGLFMTTEEMGDGSFIYYAHNKPTMEESDIVWLFTAEAIGISTDGGKTYPYGFTVTGEMITSILQTEGINADWINAGCLTVKNSAGTIVFQADIATGKVIINADSISVGGKAVATEEYAKELAEKATNLTVLLSNEYQGIPTDADGNYTTFPECLTSIQVLYGQVDITSQCSLSATTSAGITGALSGTTYTVTGLATDSGWVDIKATYLDTLMAVKRFTVSKVKDGEKGETGAAGRVYILESSATMIKRGQDSAPIPDEITFSAYYRDGSSASRTAYAGRFVIERSVDGNTWETVYTSEADETSCRYELYTAIEDGNGNYIEDGSGNAIVAWYDEEAAMFRCSLYAAGSTESTLDIQTIAVVTDVEALTQEEIFNLLTNNGEVQGIYLIGKQLYINGEYIKAKSITADKMSVSDLYALAAKIGGWDINEDSISSATNDTVLGSNGTIRVGATDSWHIQLGANGVFEQYRDAENRIIGIGSKADEPDVNNVVLEAYTQITDGLYVNDIEVVDTIYTGSTIDAGGLTVRGYKNRSVETEHYGDRLLFSYETPSPMFGDIGDSVLDDTGNSYIWLEDIFAETVDTDCDYQVFLQAYGDGSVYVAERTPYYFTVKGTPGLAFGWELKAVQKGYDSLRMEVKGSNQMEKEAVDYADEALSYVSNYYKELEEETV